MKIRKIGGLFCSEMATGEGSWHGDVRIKLSDKPLIPVHVAAAPPRMQPGTHFIEYYFEGEGSPGKWTIAHNNIKFYNKNKNLGIRCVKMMESQTVKEHPIVATPEQVSERKKK
ncbi:MAG: hypothetical protein AAB794_02125 [Patescibacteria group bacterium]